MTLTIQRKGGPAEVKRYDWSDTVRENLEAFARWIEEGTSYMFTDEQKIANIAVLEAVCRSAATNAPVRVAS